MKLLSAGCFGMLLASNVFADVCTDKGFKSEAPLKGKPTCVLSGTYTSNKFLDNTANWVLDGKVVFGGDNVNNATLSIAAGTKIYGRTGPDFLIISRGSVIEAVGAKDAPIVFTSYKLLEGKAAAAGDWGGIVISGNAPINACKEGVKVCEAMGEGETAMFGGNEADDYSGKLQYVIVEFGGYVVTTDKEINGITLSGVGSTTIIENVQVDNNKDDGIEMFGGTVNLKNLVLTNNMDDALDWDRGWIGTAENVYIKQPENRASIKNEANGIEGDNYGKEMGTRPMSNPLLSNITIIGSSTMTDSLNGILLRAGTGATIYNTIVTGFTKGSCIDFDDIQDETLAANAQENIVFENVLIDCGGKDFSIESGDLFNLGEFLASAEFDGGGFSGAKVQSAMLSGYLPKAGSPALNVPAPLGVDADYIGAVRDSANDWIAGWARLSN